MKLLVKNFGSICNNTRTNNRFQVLGFRFQVLGVRCQVLGVRCQVLGVRCQVLGFRCQVLGFRCQVLGFRCQVLGVRFQVLGFRFQVYSIFHVGRPQQGPCMQRPYKVLVMAMQFINLKSALNDRTCLLYTSPSPRDVP